MGAAEAGFFPGVIYYLTKWFPTAYRSRTIALFMMAAAGSSIVGSPLSGLIWGSMALPVCTAGQVVVLLEALPSMVFGIVLLFTLPNGPEEAKWLDPSEKQWLAARLEQDRWRRVRARTPPSNSASPIRAYWCCVSSILPTFWRVTGLIFSCRR